MQGLIGPDGPVALITVSCPVLGVTARRAEAATLVPSLVLEQASPPILPERRALALLRALGVEARGRFVLSADMPPGGGAGASTAALLALARAAGHRGGLEALAEACLAAEGASDPLMLPEPDAALWASREGRVLETLPRPPCFEIVGGFLGDGQATDPGDRRFPAIADLAADWREAAAAGDRAALAALASVSAARTTALRGPVDDPTPALAERLGALGHLRAHTGSARGLIFAPGTAPAGAESALARAGFSGTLRFLTGRDA